MRKPISLPLRMLLVFGLLAVLSTGVLARTETTDPQNPAGPVIGWPVKHDTSPPLRSIAPIPFTHRDQPTEVHAPMGTYLTGSSEEDPVVQRNNGIAAMPQPILNFDGIPRINYVPPDTNGDVGPNHYVQSINAAFKIWDKKGNALYGPVSINTLFKGFGKSCETSNSGDPIVLYDSMADRWIITQFMLSGGYGECIAISQTSDPMGAYHRYQYNFSWFPDYPKFGVWPDGYYFSFNAGGNKPLIVYDRAKMLNGQTASFQQFTQSSSNLLPSDMDGPTPPPAGTPNYFVQFSGGNALRLYKFKVDWATPSNSSLTSETLSVPSYSNLSFAPMHRFAYRNFGTHQSWVFAHAVSAAGTSGIRWYELRKVGAGSVTLHQAGTYAPDSMKRDMPSAAMDRQGNIAVGYMVQESAGQGIRYAGRLATDPLGQLTQGEAVMIKGTASVGSRWGDYASMSIDPSDDCTFWHTNEYGGSGATFRTRIATFKFPSCTGSTTPTPTPVTPTATPVTRTPTATPVTRTPTPGTVFSDDFESERGWTVNPNGSDTATLGQWERGDPEATDYNGAKQLGTTVSGSNDLVTGRLAGSGPGAYDLDGGVSSIRSPSITLPSGGNLTLSFRYYLAHASNASSDDYLRISIVSEDPTRASQTTVFEKLGAASDVDASWQSASVNVSSYAGQTIRILIEAADAGTASLVEAAIDDLTVAQ